jgi:hypothetical protein
MRFSQSNNGVLSTVMSFVRAAVRPARQIQQTFFSMGLKPVKPLVASFSAEAEAFAQLRKIASFLLC